MKTTNKLYIDEVLNDDIVNIIDAHCGKWQAKSAKSLNALSLLGLIDGREQNNTN